jgi:hypothetical protein
MIDLNVTTYWWVPAANITDPSSVSAATLTAARNISAYVHASTRVAPTASDTVSERGITDTANSVVPTIGNYEGSLTLFRDYTSGAPTANDPLTTIGAEAGIVGWIVKREGVASSTAAATGQIVQVYKFATDNPQTTGGNGEGYLKVTIPLHPQGSFDVNSTLVA